MQGCAAQFSLGILDLLFSIQVAPSNGEGSFGVEINTVL